MEENSSMEEEVFEESVDIIEYDLYEVFCEFSSHDEWENYSQNNIEPPYFASSKSTTYLLDLIRNLREEEYLWEQDELSINLYYKDIRKFKHLSANQEIELIAKAQTGDKNAFDTLILTNQRFVIFIAKQFQNLGLPLNDLISEGNIGLMKGISGISLYRYSKSYFYSYIKGEILNALGRYNQLTWLPSNLNNHVRNGKTIIEKFLLQNGRMPSFGEFYKISYLDHDIYELAMQERYIHSLESIAEATGDKADYYTNSMMRNSPDFGTEDDEFEKISELREESIAIHLAAAMRKILNRRETDILRKVFGIGCRSYSLSEIGYMYDITGERVRQLKERALKKLKRHMRKR